MSVQLRSQPLAFLAAAVAILLAGPTGHADGSESANDAGNFYSPDPNHIWNRLHRALFVRTGPGGETYGADQLDPLLWRNTEFLLTSPSHERAINLLDEFLAKHAEKLIDDPLKRAVFQRDLWAVFDWSATREAAPVASLAARRLCLMERQELQAKLAKAIRSLGLTSDQIKNLPDNYADAAASKALASQPDPNGYLPPDLFNPDGPWVCLRLWIWTPIAPTHQGSFGGRSAFLVFMKLPGGREATLSYLKKLQAYPFPWVVNTNRVSDAERLVPSPDLPQFPVGTQIALVRQAFLIDDRGELVPTHLTESVQIRVYQEIPPRRRSERWPSGQDMFEIKLSRPALFASQSGGLRAVATNEPDFVFVQFGSFGIDPFELSKEEDHIRTIPFTNVVLQTCASCHSQPGVYSVNSYAGSYRFQMPRDVEFAEANPDDERQIDAGWKRRHYTWGLLQGLWQQKPGNKP